MRRWIGTMLAAAMLTPVAAEAQRGGEGRRDGPRTEARGPGGGFRGGRFDSPARADDAPRGRGFEGRPDRDWRSDRGEDRPRGGFDRPTPAAPLPDANRVDRRGLEGRRDGDWRSERRADRIDRDAPRRGLEGRRDGEWRSERRDDRVDRDAPRRNLFEGRRDRDRRDGWNDGDRAGFGWNRWGYRGGDRNGWSDRRRWDRDWRADRRYDWSRYRGSNRGAFHLPRYYAPYDWTGGYRRFGVGVMLSRGLWGPSYWIGDPFAYRLPEAYGPYRWVRYYNDALLVDIESGEVVDTVYDIFW